MMFKFNTAAAMNFSNYAYVIALDTENPTQGQPYAYNAGNAQSWYGFSFEIIVTGNPVTATLVQFVTQPGTNGGVIKYPTTIAGYPQQLLILNPNCNGQNTQFCVQIDRHLFAGIGAASPNPAPSASTSPSASPSGSPGPSASPSATPSPTPTAAPISGIWYVNWFTAVAPQNAIPPGQTDIIDSPAGPNDRSWLPTPNQSYDTALPFDYTWQGNTGPAPSDMAAEVISGEVINAP